MDSAGLGLGLPPVVPVEVMQADDKGDKKAGGNGDEKRGGEFETFTHPNGRTVRRPVIPRSCWTAWSEFCSFNYKIVEGGVITSLSWNQGGVNAQGVDLQLRDVGNGFYDGFEEPNAAWCALDFPSRLLADLIQLTYISVTHTFVRLSVAPHLQRKLNDLIYLGSDLIWPGQATRHFIKNPGGSFQDYQFQAMSLLFGMLRGGYTAGSIAGEETPSADQKAGGLSGAGLYKPDPLALALFGSVCGSSVTAYGLWQARRKDGKITWVNPPDGAGLGKLRVALQQATRAAYAAEGPYFSLAAIQAAFSSGMEIWRFDDKHGDQNTARAIVSGLINAVIHYKRVNRYFKGLRSAYTEDQWKAYIGRAANDADRAQRVHLHEQCKRVETELRDKRNPSVATTNLLIHLAVCLGMGAAWAGLIHYALNGGGHTPVLPERGDTLAPRMSAGASRISPLEGSLGFAGGALVGTLAEMISAYLAEWCNAPLPQPPRDSENAEDAAEQDDAERGEVGLRGERKGGGAGDQKRVEETPEQVEARFNADEHRAGMSKLSASLAVAPAYGFLGAPGVLGVAAGGLMLNGVGARFAMDWVLNPSLRIAAHVRNFACGSRPARQPDGAAELAPVDHKAGPGGEAPEAGWPPEHGPLDKRLEFLPGPQFRLEGIDCVAKPVDEHGMAHIIARNHSNPLHVAYIADLGGPQGLRAKSEETGVGKQVKFVVTIVSLRETWEEELASRARASGPD